MEDYLDAWIVVIILFIAGLISAAIVYYAIKIIGYIANRNNFSENSQAFVDFIAWFFALSTWAIVDYFLFQYFR
jgi:hypothetical protein